MMDKTNCRKADNEYIWNPFDKTRLSILVKNLVNHLDESNNFLWAGNRIPNAGLFSLISILLNAFGKYKDEENDIDILIVNLKKESSLEHARTRQRNFVARYLDEHNKSAAASRFCLS